MFDIVSNTQAMTITVGGAVFREPRLARLPERDCSFRRAICGEAPWDDGPKAAYKFYAARLGIKFNRRFQAANYWLWVGNRLHEKTGNMLRHEGRRWLQYNDDLVLRANHVLHYVNEAERDELFNIIPVIITFGKSPQSIRQDIGRGAWRRVANNSVSRNTRLMNAMYRSERCGKKRGDTDTFARFIEFPSGVLRGAWNASDYEVVAARVAPRKTAESFQHTTHLVQDAHRMIGADFNPYWGLARIVREHDNAAREVLRGRFKDTPFTEGWTFEADGYRAELLTSELDIATEGKSQHHCVASHAKQAARGQYIVLKIEGKERATAGLTPSGRVDQVYAACNGHVSEGCVSFTRRAAAEYMARNVRAAA